MSLKEITHCEVCGNHDLTSVMNLGDLPIPDDLVKVGDDRICEKYPTEILFCNTCKTAHQRWELPPDKVFHPEYHYRAANTKDVLMGLEQLVDAIETQDGVVAGKKVLDVGCNDGCLLDVFKRRGAYTYGIEPTLAYKDAIAKGHAVVRKFLNMVEAAEFVRHFGHPDIITFTNVFAHITNLPALIASVGILRGPKTKVIIENHYLGSVIERKQFDTFYHEHLRTYSYTSFLYMAKTMGMAVEWVQFPQRYGGNIRVCLTPDRSTPNAPGPNEELFRDRMVELDRQVKEWQHNKCAQLMDEIDHVTNDAHIITKLPVAALPGRAIMLFTLLGFDERHISAVYEVPISKKIGHYVPGTRIPIKSDADFPWDTYKGPVLNTAWHIANEIERRWRQEGFKGTMIQAIDPKDFA